MYHRLDNTEYAVKIVHVDPTDLEEVYRVVREVRLLAQLSHPHIVRYHMAWLEGPASSASIQYDEEVVVGGGGMYRCCIKMELCDDSLRSYFTRLRGGGIPSFLPPTVKPDTLYEEILEGLHYLHTMGVVHNDLRPENILLRGGTAKIADFGLSFAPSDHALRRSPSTGGYLGSSMEGYLEGTVLYGAPEIQRDKASDIYSLGLVYLELLCHGFATDMERILSIRALRERRDVPPQVPSKDTMLIRSMTSPLPEHRPLSETLIALVSKKGNDGIGRDALCRDIVWGVVLRAVEFCKTGEEHGENLKKK
jgi:serine/threonine protein kinase